MKDRQKILLKSIVSEYIKTAEPVSSKFIALAGDFALSPATIRNEMAELEDQGYICHPHTSAGRVPTEKGYRFFVDNYLTDEKLSKKEKECLDSIFQIGSSFEPIILKNLAKKISDFCQNAVFVAFSENDFYYTGLSNLFSQPEFSEHQVVYNLTKVIDHLDVVVNKIYSQIDSDVKISIGSENPFAIDCSSIIAKYDYKNENGLLGIIGPIRMDYQNNFSLINYSQNLINNFSNKI